MIIGFTGAAGSGKTTAAKLLGYPVISFATPLKEMVAVVLRAAGQDVYRCLKGDLKETPIAALGGRSPRYLLQTLGTEWGRMKVHADLWVNLAIRQAQQQIDGSVVIDDVRFDNEVEAIRTAGGIIIRLEGRGGIDGGHASERVPEYADIVVQNDAGVGWLRDHLKYRVTELIS